MSVASTSAAAAGGVSQTAVVHGLDQFTTHNAGRKILVIRHGWSGERIDFTFNEGQTSWVHKCFDEQGRFRRINVNMPRTLPLRRDGYANYVNDTPLTEIGYLQAKLTGRALRDAGVSPTHVYASSALRCVQTAVGLLKGMNNTSISMCVEPGLFEWGAWFRPARPRWMQPSEFTQLGYPINTSYISVCKEQDIDPSEQLVDYYNRSYKVVQRILDRHKDEKDCTIVLVAHGASLDTCTRQLCGGKPRKQHEFFHILHGTPYLATAATVEFRAAKRWAICQPPILPLQHQSNVSYNWQLLHKTVSEDDA